MYDFIHKFCYFLFRIKKESKNKPAFFALPYIFSIIFMLPKISFSFG